MGDLAIRGLLFGVQIRARDFWRLLCVCICIYTDEQAKGHLQINVCICIHDDVDVHTHMHIYTYAHITYTDGPSEWTTIEIQKQRSRLVCIILQFGPLYPCTPQFIGNGSRRHL